MPQSQSSTVVPGYKSRTVKIEPHGEGIKVSVDGVSGDGRKHSYSYTAHYDGKDYPVTGNPAADTIAYKRIDDNTVEATTKKGGKVAATHQDRSCARRKEHDCNEQGDGREGAFHQCSRL